MRNKKLITGIGLIASTFILGACSNTPVAARPAPPEDTQCRDWDWDGDTGTWKCDESKSVRYGSYYYGGAYHTTKSGLTSSSSYNSYKNSANFAGKTSSFSKGNSGFGSSSFSSGG